jgi:hypothetical protein
MATSSNELSIFPAQPSKARAIPEMSLELMFLWANPVASLESIAQVDEAALDVGGINLTERGHPRRAPRTRVPPSLDRRMTVAPGSLPRCAGNEGVELPPILSDHGERSAPTEWATSGVVLLAAQLRKPSPGS